MVLDFEQRLAGLMDGERIKKDEPMKKHVTFRVGGNADYFVTVKNADEIAAVINLCKEEKVPILLWETAVIFSSGTKASGALSSRLQRI